MLLNRMFQLPSLIATQPAQITEHTLELPFFSVTVQCKGLGEAKVMPCKKDGEPYVISGCLPYTCKSPKNSVEEGYQVFLRLSIRSTQTLYCSFRTTLLGKRCRPNRETGQLERPEDHTWRPVETSKRSANGPWTTQGWKPPSAWTPGMSKHLARRATRELPRCGRLVVF